MSTFTWKKRSGQCIPGKSRLAAFSLSDDEASDSDSDVVNTMPLPTRTSQTSALSVDELPSAEVAVAPHLSAPHPVLNAAEQSAALREQGSALAELDRFWEALKFWDEAAALRPDDAELHEMRAQALLHLHELQPAVEAAARAVQLRPRWPAAQQMLGRALLGLGELALARRAFSIAFHLQPDDSEVRTDDLLWTCCLLERARRRGRGAGGLCESGGVVSHEQTSDLLRQLGWHSGVTSASTRCHVDWQPLAEDWLAEEREKERAQEEREEEEADERARRDAEEEERVQKAAARMAWRRAEADMEVD